MLLLLLLPHTLCRLGSTPNTLRFGRPTFTSSKVDLAQRSAIENGILPNIYSVDVGHTEMLLNDKTGELVQPRNILAGLVIPHTLVYKPGVVPYQYAQNMKEGMRYLSPSIDAELLLAAGLKVARDCQQGLCHYTDEASGHHKSSNPLYRHSRDKDVLGNIGRLGHQGDHMPPGVQQLEQFGGNGLVNELPTSYGVEHILDDPLPVVNDGHYHYEILKPEERFMRIHKPLHLAAGNLHVLRPQDRDFESDVISDYNPYAGEE